MLPCTAGARPGKINMIFLPNSANSRLFPERKPSPTPTSSNKDPTPQAIPNIVRNERSLCAHRLRKICAKISKTVRINETTLYPFDARLIGVQVVLSAQGRPEALTHAKAAPTIG